MPAGMQSPVRVFLPQLGLQKQGLWRGMAWRQPDAGRIRFLPDSKHLLTGGGFIALWRL